MIGIYIVMFMLFLYMLSCSIFLISKALYICILKYLDFLAYEYESSQSFLRVQIIHALFLIMCTIIGATIVCFTIT